MFGGGDVLGWDPFVPLSSSTRAKLRGSIKREVNGCTGCPAHRSCAGPVSPTFAPAPRFAVITDAPTKDESARGVHGTGKLARVLARAVSRVGMDWDADVCVLNVVACHVTGEGGRPRQPVQAEVLACRDNLMRGLEAADVEFVLLVGGTAVSAWRTDVTLGDVRGGLYLWRNKWVVMPIDHPVSVMKDQSLMEGWRRDLERWSWVVEGEVNPLEFITGDGVGCKWKGCRGIGEWLDGDGLAYCTNHRLKGEKAWMEQRDAWKALEKKIERKAWMAAGRQVEGQGALL